jgi:hypothetical protein
MPREEPPLLYPGSSAAPLRLANQVTFDPPKVANPHYVLHSVPYANGYLFGGSDNSIRAFSHSLEPQGNLPTTQKNITSMTEGSGKDSNAVFVTAKDGTVACWDTRDLTKEAFKLKSAYLPSERSHDIMLTLSTYRQERSGLPLLVAE